MSCIWCSIHPEFTQDTPGLLLSPSHQRRMRSHLTSLSLKRPTRRLGRSWAMKRVAGIEFRVVVRGITSSRPSPTNPRPEKLNSHGVVATDRQKLFRQDYVSQPTPHMRSQRKDVLASLQNSLWRR